MMSEKIIKNLKLLTHPEGGYYKEMYRAEQKINLDNGKSRNVSTAIFYLLENEDKSRFHRIASDELWFFHQGNPLEILSIQNGNLIKTVLGNNFEDGEVLQAVIPAHTWFASRVKNSKGYALVSCTVAPGFDFADFELADRDKLINEFPDLITYINALK
jgi:predicted cupin superfamily sugar epimerase